MKTSNEFIAAQCAQAGEVVEILQPVAYITGDRRMLVFADKVDLPTTMTPLYAEAIVQPAQPSQPAEQSQLLYASLLKFAQPVQPAPPVAPVALAYCGSAQLRERIAHIVVPLLQDAQPVPPTIKQSLTVAEQSAELDAGMAAQHYCWGLWGAAQGHSDWRKVHEHFASGYKQGRYDELQAQGLSPWPDGKPTCSHEWINREQDQPWLVCEKCGASYAQTIAQPAKLATDTHSCSYFCERPACIKSQRDDLRALTATLQTTKGKNMTRSGQIKRFGNIHENFNGKIVITQFDFEFDAMAMSHAQAALTLIIERLQLELAEVNSAAIAASKGAV